jgi:hypothetical protein
MRTEPGEPVPMSPVMSPITDMRPSLEVAHVLQGQGIDDLDRAAPGVVAVAQQVLDEAQALLAPAAVYTVLPVHDLHHQTVSLDGGVTFEGPLVARALAGAREVALAVCTIGAALEERVTALFAAGHTLQALALDGAGTAAVGEVSRMVGARICDAASARGLSVGMRASPGQEGWSIWQQRTLFGLVPGDEIGVRLTESCLMLPRKSVSFALGLGPEMQADAVPCDFCSKRERCRWRKEGIQASDAPRICHD